jgi:putative hydrolase of the HAD superfamily
MIVNSDIEAVVLDIDGTLCSLTDGVGAIYHELLRAQGLHSDPAKLELAARRVWKSFRDTYLNTSDQYRTTHDREREVWLEFVRRVCGEANLTYGSNAQIVGSIYEAFASSAYRTIQPGAIEFLRRAKERGFLLVAASNNDARSKVTLKELGLEPFLSHVFVAGDLGWKKPSPHFYEALATRVGLRPENILHVGNDRELDVEGAMRAGFAAVLYAPQGGGSSPHVISFAELGALIGL